MMTYWKNFWQVLTVQRLLLPIPLQQQLKQGSRGQHTFLLTLNPLLNSQSVFTFISKVYLYYV